MKSRIFFCLFAGVIASSLNVSAVTIVVNSTNDPAGFNPGITVAQLGATVTLRDAINAARNANGLGSEQVITFDPSLAGQTITIEQSELLTQRSGVDLNNRFLRFEGLTNSPGVMIAASTNGRIGRLFACLGEVGTSVTFNNLTFRYANNGTNNLNWGGGFFIAGTVTFNNCAILNCSAGVGGAIYLTGADSLLTMNNCTIAGNVASSGGGAIYQNHGRIVLNHVTIAYNSSATAGGGLVGTGILLPQVNNSIIANNFAPLGWTDIQTRLTPTSSNNLCSAVPFANGQTFEAGNNAGNMINGVNGNIVGVNAHVGPPGYFGSPTVTILLLNNSPALNAIAATTLPTDQRGITRPQGSAPDMGAFEARHPAPPTLATNVFTRLVSEPSFDLVTAISPSPTGGTLSGPGISGSTFDPATAGPGVHRILYRVNGQPASPDGITWSTAEITITVTEASGLVVTTTNDVTANMDGVTSLREALAYAATLPGTQTVTFASSLTASGPATLTLNQTGISNEFGASAFAITNTIAVQGPASGHGITIFASGVTNRRHFFVAPGSSLSLANLTLTGGRTIDIRGGSIFSKGALTINGCTFAGNSASGINIDGGVIATDNGAGTSLFVQNSTFASNSAPRRGAAIFNVANSLTLIHVTVVDNTSESAVWHASTPATIINTIIARNFNGVTPADLVLAGASFSPQSANNLIGTAAASLYLGTLANNGGPTPTATPLPLSPARDAGVVVPGITNDQAGAARVVGSAPDIGAYEMPALQESLVVTTATDENDGSSDPDYGTGTSLREAVAYANTLTNAPMISFASALTASGPAMLTLTQAGHTNIYGPSALRITNNVTVQGPTGTNGITLFASGGGDRRHVFVEPGATFSVSNLTFTGGKTSDRGAAIASVGTLNIGGCSFTGNVSMLEGGAVHCLFGATSLLIQNSTFAGNSAATYGGALVSGALNSTLVNVTMVDNTSGNGAYWLYDYPCTMINTIIARNFAGTNAADIVFFGTANFTAQSGNNLIGAGGAGNLVNGVDGNQVGVTNLGLAPLGSNGGPTPTMLLQFDSPALNAGVVVPGLTTDQRGVARPQNSFVDIGAVETLITAAASSVGSLTLGLDGSASGSFTSIPGVGFTLYAGTNLFTPLHLWSNLGPAVETPPGSGVYQFTTPPNTNAPHQFYRTQSP